MVMYGLYTAVYTCGPTGLSPPPPPPGVMSVAPVVVPLMPAGALPFHLTM